MRYTLNKLRDIDGSWARIVSYALSPPVVWAVLILSITFNETKSPEQAFLWVSIYSGLVCLLPVLYIAWMVQRGKIGDLLMRNREERLGPFLVLLVSSIIAWLTLRFMGAPPILPLLALISIAQTVIMVLITLVWQISMHTMTITSVAIVTVAVFGIVYALFTIPLIILVSAARLRLNRHTPAQIFAGMLLGALTPIVALAAM